MTLSVSGDEILSLSAAQKNERNVLARLRRSHATRQLFKHLWGERKVIEAVAAHHLGRTATSACSVQGTETWSMGQFNICIVIHVRGIGDKTSKLIFRCPMPHKVGEQYWNGAVDEKIRAEVATYAWIEANCPEIPTPCLRGFGFSRNLQFTHRAHGAGYDLDPSGSSFDRPYLLLDYIDSEKGTMLSDTLKDFRENDKSRLRNLLCGISRVMISLASKTQPCIGSLRFNDNGSITLANRPLLCANSILESEGAPRTVNKTYTTCGNFVDDMLQFREEAFSAQPNAVNDEEDCLLQMFHMVILRRMKPHFVDRHFEGPFVLQFTDFHASNIFVDDKWNIVALIDLEFVCALPPSMMSVPHWLSVDAIDDMSSQSCAVQRMQELFVRTIQNEERLLNQEREVSLALSIQDSWRNHSCWFYRCLTTINGMAYCLEDHLYRKFSFEPSLDEERRYAKILSARWSSDSRAFVEQKLRDKAKYDEDLAWHFARWQDKGNIEGSCLNI